MSDSRDISIIRHILRYCNEIQEAIDLFGDDKQVFIRNAVYRNSVATPIEQIGELAKRLSDPFRMAHQEIPWKAVKGMRTWFAHQYLNMDQEIIWKVMHENIPILKAFCERILL